MAFKMTGWSAFKQNDDDVDKRIPQEIIPEDYQNAKEIDLGTRGIDSDAKMDSLMNRLTSLKKKQNKMLRSSVTDEDKSTLKNLHREITKIQNAVGEETI